MDLVGKLGWKIRAYDPFSQGTPTLGCFLPKKAHNIFHSLRRQREGWGRKHLLRAYRVLKLSLCGLAVARMLRAASPTAM